ncbi:tautomerase family protein [Paraburkholderia sp. J67]|uniref:tautomerase family protein n=1 Tax=Paraburkholderia sp. J67 TaxID=2805435 RepID=UPI002ABD9824|nr:tautomerase family protein [Paraburkholderia sp. J67]
MPVIQVNIHKWDIEKKREMVAKVTNVFTELGVPRELVMIQIREDELDNVGVGGVLLVDQPPPGAR